MIPHTALHLSAIVLLLSLCAAPAIAGGKDDPHGHAAYPARHVALFIGVADPAAHAALALGADAEWRLPLLGHRLGAGTFADVTLGEHTHGLVGAGLFLHPGAGLRLLIAPALALSEGHREAAFRAGVGYDFHVGHVSVTPTLNVDFVGSHVTPVAGFAVSTGF